MLSNSQIVIILLVVMAGYYLFWTIAKRNISPWQFKSFFLGGANLGTDLTENNTLGITFAWSGGTWYFAWLAYQYGPWVVVSQIFWCTSIIALALLLPRIIRNVRNKTIHGFLRDHYGQPSQRVAAIATTTGYVINAGFELFWASLLFSLCLGREDLRLPFAIFLAVIVGSYCMVGGYKSNATIDKTQNIMGVAALAGLVAFVTSGLHIDGLFARSSLIFVWGSAVYIVISLLMYRPQFRRYRLLQNTVSILYAVSAFVIVFILLKETNVPDTLHRVVNNKPIPFWIIFNTVTFQIFFNVIDMQNWQEIAANGDANPKTYSALSWAVVRGSLYLIWFPALGGVLLGCALRSIDGSLTDVTLFPKAFDLVLPASSYLARGLVLGLLFLGFIATSLSTAGDLLMSALQTYCFDILWPSRVEKLVETPGSEPAQRELVLRARAWLIPMAVAMVLIFFALWKLYPGPVFNFQAVMYAAPLSLLTPILFALFRPQSALEGGGIPAFVALSASIICVAVMFGFTMIPGRTDDQITWLVSLMPIAANGISFVLFFITRLIVGKKGVLKKEPAGVV